MTKIINAQKHIEENGTSFRHADGRVGCFWELDGDTVIEGDVPDNSYIYIQNGSLDVQGNIGNGVEVLTRAKQNKIGSFLSKILSLSFSRAAKTLKPVMLNFLGNIGDNFKLDSSDDFPHKIIRITGALGDNAQIKYFPVDTQITTNTIGNNFEVLMHFQSKESDVPILQKTRLTFVSMGDGAHVNMPGRIEGGTVGDGARLMVSAMRVDRVGERSEIYSGMPGLWDRLKGHDDFQFIIGDLGHNSNIYAPNVTVMNYGENCSWSTKGYEDKGEIFRPRQTPSQSNSLH